MSSSLRLEKVSVRRDRKVVLDEISLQIVGGEFVGVVGPNGAGKTTLLQVLAGLRPPSTGSAHIDDAPALALASRRRAQRVAYLPQLRELYWDMDAEAVVALGRFPWGDPQRLNPADRAAVERALVACGAAQLRRRIVTTLSGGEQARVHLARALASETGALVADEPVAALDPYHQLAIMTVLRSRANAGSAVVAALHDLDLAQAFCTRIVILAEGRLLADNVPSAALTPDIIRSAFRVDARLTDRGGLALSLPA